MQLEVDEVCSRDSRPLCFKYVVPIGSSSWTKAGWHGAVTLALAKKQAELEAGVTEVELEGCHVPGGAAGSRGRPRCSKVFAMFPTLPLTPTSTAGSVLICKSMCQAGPRLVSLGVL